MRAFWLQAQGLPGRAGGAGSGQAVNTHVPAHQSLVPALEDDSLPRTHRQTDGQQRGGMPTQARMHSCTRPAPPVHNPNPRSETHLNYRVLPSPLGLFPTIGGGGAGGYGVGLRVPGGVTSAGPISRGLGKRQERVGWNPKGHGSGGSLRGNLSTVVPWERRVRPAPYVKNSAAAGTASRGWGRGGGALRQPGQVWWPHRVLARGGEGTYGDWERMYPSRSQSPNSPSLGSRS